jgi:hypothetical protein
MILSTRLHTLEATLSSMTLRVLNLVQAEELEIVWKFIEKKSAETELKISCMQFGILLLIPLHCNG